MLCSSVRIVVLFCAPLPYACELRNRIAISANGGTAGQRGANRRNDNPGMRPRNSVKSTKGMKHAKSEFVGEFTLFVTIPPREEHYCCGYRR